MNSVGVCLTFVVIIYYFSTGSDYNCAGPLRSPSPKITSRNDKSVTVDRTIYKCSLFKCKECVFGLLFFFFFFKRMKGIIVQCLLPN